MFRIQSLSLPTPRLVFFLALFLALFLACTTAGAQTRELSSRGEMLDSIVAVVNDGVVLNSELDAETTAIIARLQQQGTELPPRSAIVPQVLERLIIKRIQLQRASRAGIQIPDEMLNQAISRVADRMGTTLSELPTILAAEGINYSAYRADMRDQITIDQLRQRDVIARIAVTPREIEEYIEREAGRASRNEEFNISHILISVSANSSNIDIEIGRQKALNILNKLNSGESFAELAVANSNGQNALEGGALGWRRGDELPTLFSTVVPDLEVGMVSEPLRSASGFHLVKLNDKRGAEKVMEDQMQVRHILITTNEVLDDQAARQKLTEIREQIIEGDNFEAVATVMSEDPGSAINGGDLGWNGPGIFVPEFQTVCENMPLNEISEPFKSPFGWHIVEVIGRRVQDMTDEMERRDAIMAIRSSKLEEETELWARRLRDQAFVEYKM
ncbi:MAG: peptidylprolyl isomerase [Gammaproteobacteria bacterium]|nr:peptidylprolyl isomerase [Gammaproteobacteria bacterium]